MAGGIVNGGVEVDWGSVFSGLKDGDIKEKNQLDQRRKFSKKNNIYRTDFEMDKLVADWHQKKRSDEDKEKRREYIKSLELSRQDKINHFRDFHSGSWADNSRVKIVRPEGADYKDWHRKRMIDLYKFDPEDKAKNWVNKPTNEELNNNRNNDKDKEVEETDKYLEKGFYNDLYFASWMDMNEDKTREARERLKSFGVDVISFYDDHKSEEMAIKSKIIEIREAELGKTSTGKEKIDEYKAELVDIFGLTKDTDSDKEKEKTNKISLEELESLDVFESGLKPLERRDKYNEKLNRMHKLAPSEEMGNEIVKNYFHAVDCLLVKDAKYPEFPNKETARNFLKEYFGYKPEEGFDRKPLLDIYKKHAIDYYWQDASFDSEEGLLSFGGTDFNNTMVIAEVFGDIIACVNADEVNFADKRLVALGYDLEEIKSHRGLAEAIRVLNGDTLGGIFKSKDEAYKYIVENWQIEERKNRLYRSEYLHTDDFCADLSDLYPERGDEDVKKERSIELKFKTIGLEVIRILGTKKKDCKRGRDLIKGIREFYKIDEGKRPPDWDRTVGLLKTSGIEEPEIVVAREKYRKEVGLDKVKSTEDEGEKVPKVESRPTNPIERLRLLADPEKWDNMMAVIEAMDEAKKKKYRLSLRIIMYQLEHPEERSKTAGRWESLYLPFLRQMGVDVPAVV